VFEVVYFKGTSDIDFFKYLVNESINGKPEQDGNQL
jgi:hypothetical protein